MIAAWQQGDAEALSAVIHPETEIETPMASRGGLTRGRENAVAQLLRMRDSFFSIDVEHVQEVSETEGVVFVRARTPLPGGGFKDGELDWQIELLDGMLWRSRIIYVRHR